MKNRIRELRIARGLYQSDLAEHLPCNKNHVGNLEREEREPTCKILVALSDYFNVSIDYLLYRENIPHSDHMESSQPLIKSTCKEESHHGNEES